MNSQAMQRIVNVLHETPGLSREQIAERAFVGKTTLSGGGYLKKMKEAGLIHISGWLRNGSGSFSTPLYSAGQNDDFPRPGINAQNRLSPGMQRLLDAIEEFGPIDYRQAAEIAALSIHTVKNSGYLEILIAQRKIHIAEWRRRRQGAMYPLYEGGAGKSAPRPQALSGAERLKRYRQHTSPTAATVAGQLRIATL